MLGDCKGTNIQTQKIPIAYPVARSRQLARSKEVICSWQKTISSVQKVNRSSSRNVNSRECMSWPSASIALRTVKEIYDLHGTLIRNDL